MSALVGRLRAAQEDMVIVVTEDPRHGDHEHPVVGILPEDVEAILAILNETEAAS